MTYKTGDIILVKFPFTNLEKSKKRPVLVVKSENDLNDIVCFQITSNPKQSNLLKIENKRIFSGLGFFDEDKNTQNNALYDRRASLC